MLYAVYYFRNYNNVKNIKTVAAIMGAAMILVGCASMTTSVRQTPNGKEVAIGQFPPKPESECELRYNEVIEKNLLERYTAVGSVASHYADSNKALTLADKHDANYVHIYMPAEKKLFGVIDLNYNDKPRATYYQCKKIPHK